MIFNSLEFLVYFPIVAIAYFWLPIRFRTLWLLAASYYFYMAWEPAYILLILASTMFDYVAGVMMGRCETRQGRRKWLLVSLVTNLGLLGFFKYYNFFAANINELATWIALPVELPRSHFLLPVGISFYTFQTLSYSIEVYRGTLKAERNFGLFALYVAFFPQLVAGPIERAGNLLPALRRHVNFDYERTAGGLKLMAWGMFKKVVIADRIAILVDAVYANPVDFDGSAHVVATVLFAFQIYCDFSGYSDIAIGCAQIFGIRLMENFRQPYLADSVADFWRRWHISLSTWFRDYVYVPLGGNRVARRRWLSNLMIVFVVSGLWHGAAWTYLFWGALHGSLLVLSNVTGGIRASLLRAAGLARFPRFLWLLRVVFTFLLVDFAWLFFRAGTLADAGYMLTHLDSGWSSLSSIAGLRAFLASVGLHLADGLIISGSIALMMLVETISSGEPIRDLFGRSPTIVRWSFYYLLMATILFFAVTQRSPFLYFQF